MEKTKSEMEKDLDYYLGLSYKIEIVPIPPEDGGGYEANLPEIGRFAIVGDGETPAEAIADLERTKAEQFRHYLEKGTDIPEPGAESREKIVMPYPVKDYLKDYVLKHIRKLPPEEVLEKLSPEDRVRGLSPKELPGGFFPEELLSGFSDEELDKIADIIRKKPAGR